MLLFKDIENNKTGHRGMGSHQSAKMGKEEWLTPPDLLKKLGNIYLDPCAPIKRPWETAKNHFTINDNGLCQTWENRVYCNPPYGLKAKMWLKKCSEHRNATALIFARTETKMFFDFVWSKAHSLLFIKGRLHFYHVTGERAKANAGAPSVLVAYDELNSNYLKNSGIKGKHIFL